MERLARHTAPRILVLIAFSLGVGPRAWGQATSGRVEHPLTLVAFASAERIMARMDSLGQLVGLPAGNGLMAGLGDDDFLKLLTLPGLDPKRPLGMMSFPRWKLPNEDELANSVQEVFDDPLGLLTGMILEQSSVAMCFPAAEPQRLLDSVATLIDKEQRPTAIEGRPGWFAMKDDNMQIGIVGTYVIIAVDENDPPEIVEEYPAFDKLARSSLGSNGFVYSVYRAGLPETVRDLWIPALQNILIAQQQQRDGEDEVPFRLRTAFSPLQNDLVSLLLTETDEFRVTGHIDSATHNLQLQLELHGPRGGKLAKASNRIKVKSNPFSRIVSGPSVLASTLSLPLPKDQWRPLVDALTPYASALGGDWEGLLHVVIRTIESNQFDVYFYQPTWNEGALALSIRGHAAFPEQFERILKAAGGAEFEANVDEVDGIPIHRVATSLQVSPLSLLLQFSFYGFAGGLANLSEAGFVEDRAEADFVVPDSTAEVSDAQAVPVPQASPSARQALWMTATPEALWIGLGPQVEAAPDWFKDQIVASRAEGKSLRGAPFRLALWGLGAAPLVDQVSAESMTDEERNRGNVLRDLPNGIQCEMVPTDTGIRLRVTFEEAYCHWWATYIKDSIPKSE